MGRHGVAAYAAWAMAATLAGTPSSAQERKPQPPAGPIRIDSGYSTIDTEGDAQVIYFTGGVVIRQGNIDITADRAMAWYRGGKEPAELYLEGNVVYARGDQKLRAERIYVNLAYDKAMVVDLRLQGQSTDLKQKFFLSAREARMLMAGRFDAHDISISTCSYAVPHYHLSIKRALLSGQDPIPRESRMHWFPYDKWSFRVEEVYPEIGGLPFFFVPGLLIGPWIREFPLRSVTGGRTSRFGVYVYSEFGGRIKKADDDGHERTWGDVALEADWREKRGGAWGMDLKYSWGRYEGFLDTYFLHDQGRDLEVDFETKFPPLEREERGRLHAFHRHDLSDEWRFEVEANYLSDRGLLEEFFEKEFKEAKEPETAAYLRWRDGFAGGYVLERHRVNDFQTQNEYLPRAELMLFHWPLLERLLDNLYLTQRADLSHVRRRFDEDLHLESFRTWRLDLLTELSMPWDLGPLQVAPFARHRTTAYDDDLSGEREVRELWTVGARASTQIHATHPGVVWELAGLRGLRHVFEVEARYANALSTSVRPSELFPFEELDGLGEFEEYALEVRHRFQTRDADGKKFEFLNAGAAIEYYPRRERDTAAADVGNFLPPFHWITLAPAPSGAFDRRDWSNVHYDLTFQPLKIMRLYAAGEYNPETRHEEVRELEARFDPFPGVGASLGHAFTRGLTDAWSVGASLAVAEKWAVSGFFQYDFKVDEYVTQSLQVGRDYHDFILQAVFERDVGRDERRFYVALVPKFLGPRALRRH